MAGYDDIPGAVVLLEKAKDDWLANRLPQSSAPDISDKQAVEVIRTAFKV